MLVGLLVLLVCVRIFMMRALVYCNTYRRIRQDAAYFTRTHSSHSSHTSAFIPDFNVALNMILYANMLVSFPYSLKEHLWLLNRYRFILILFVLFFIHFKEE